MSEPQKHHWDLLLEIDHRGRKLTKEEIDFVSGLIDGDCEGKLSTGEMARIRALHRHRVEN